ncbi:MAG: UvrD-helicase domain-containing protein [Oscillospiraceae bacterium]|jgi:ATP-dependent helicase/nuclease subunit A|nr:UvrD-helicase domain-containing protein [Oscillospiraceae bacterium]
MEKSLLLGENPIQRDITPIPAKPAGRSWTAAQRAAIVTRGRNLLVSASAGSGKTAVLIERVLSLLREGAGLGEMLIVTYTRAAASEMRERLFDALAAAAEESAGADTERLRDQAAWIETADIRTLHSFCGQLLKSYFQAADVDPLYRVLDSTQSAALRAQAMDQALIEWYEVHRAASPVGVFAVDGKARALTECLSPSELAALAFQLYDFIMARPEPWEWLRSSLDAIPTDEEGIASSGIARILMSTAADSLAALLERANKLADTCARTEEWRAFAKTAIADADMISTITQAARKDYNEFRAAIRNRKWATRAKAPKDSDKAVTKAYDDKRDKLKDAFQKAASVKLFSASLAAHAQDCLAMRDELESLAELTRMFNNHYAMLKDEHSALDYSDLEQRSLRALGDPLTAESLRARYAHIFVDEYQDSTPLQEALLTRIARGNNLFFVGDVKQSIYRFRDAEPGLFLDKYKQYEYIDTAPPDRLPRGASSETLGGARIDLDRNFRSSKAILQAVNDVFTRIQRASAFEIDYDERARMKPGRDDEGCMVEAHILIKDPEPRVEQPDNDEAEPEDKIAQEEERLLKDIEKEARLTARMIQRLTRAGVAKYGDMVILLRSAAGRAVKAQDILREYGIPAQTSDAEDFFEQLEVRQAIDLLSVIDNPRQDVPLIGALRGPAAGLDEARLARIRLADPENFFYDALLAASREHGELGETLRSFTGMIEDAQFRAKVQPIHELLSGLLDQTNLYATAGAKPNGAARQANLRQLLSRAETYQRERGGSLHSFLSALDEQRESGGTQAQDESTPTDCVRIMTIHKSKGLQFGTVFILGLGARFNRKDENKPLLAHSRLGLGLRVYNPDEMTERAPLASKAIRAAIQRESLAEEMRILYVGMTRAQERLILCGSTAWEDWMDDAGIVEPTDAELLQAPTPLHWLIRGIPRVDEPRAAEPDAPYELPTRYPWRVFTHGAKDLRPAAPDLTPAAQDQSEAIPTEPADSFFPRIPEIELIPYKQSVSQRVRAATASEPPLPERPLFIQSNDKPTATESGIALHAILAHTDLAAMRSQPILNALMETVARLVRNGILSDRQAQSIALQPLYLFYSSDIGKRLIAAKEVRREWAFNLLDENRRALVQGVVDCAFMTDGGWTLIDYKSDRADDLDALAKRYAPQVRMYADALRRITGRPVCEQALYMLSYNKAYMIDGREDN